MRLSVISGVLYLIRLNGNSSIPAGAHKTA